MSLKNNKTQQMTLNDSFLNQTVRTQKMIQKSWAADFAEIVFPAINEDRFSVLYSDNPASRPDTPLNVIVGALMLKENNNLNDDEFLAAICCDVRYQYALHTTSFPEQPVIFLFKIGAYNFNKLLRYQRRTRARSAHLAAVA